MDSFCVVCGKIKSDGTDLKTHGMCAPFCLSLWEFWLERPHLNGLLTLRCFYRGMNSTFALSRDARLV